MDGNTTTPFLLTGTSANILTDKVLITRCGGNGIVVPASSGVSHINSANIDFFPINIEDGSSIVAGTVGILIADSDNAVSNCEIKGGFDTGVRLTGGNNALHNVISDQCNIGVHDYGSRNMITAGCRMQFNYVCGLKVGSATSPTQSAVGGIYVGNNITRNNPLRSQVEGDPYTGTNVILERMDGGILSNNEIDNSGVGVEYLRVSQNTQIGFNALRNLDGVDYDFTANTGDRTSLVEERRTSSIAGTVREADMRLAGVGVNLNVNDVTQVAITDGKVNVADTAATLAFFEGAGAVKQTGVTVDAAAIHAALVAYGMISA